MTYREYSNQWIVVRQMPSSRIVLGRYRKRSDAEGHLTLMRQQMPRGNFAASKADPFRIAFDAPSVKL